MLQLRFHGRSGRGVVTAAELLTEAAFIEGRHAQAFPRFGPQLMGTPVMSFCRIDDKPIAVGINSIERFLGRRSTPMQLESVRRRARPSRRLRPCGLNARRTGTTPAVMSFEVKGLKLLRSRGRLVAFGFASLASGPRHQRVRLAARSRASRC